jgi:hypothetical protein
LKPVVYSRRAEQQRTIIDIPGSSGYRRIDYPKGNFSRWLQNRPLKPDTSIITHTGAEISRHRYSRFAVLDLPLLLSDDLEQCADFAMRLWAEYHRETGRLESLYLFDYSGNRLLYSRSGLSFLQFLRRSFAFSNSYSLKQGCSLIGDTEAGGTDPVPELQPGDMFVQTTPAGSATSL